MITMKLMISKELIVYIDEYVYSNKRTYVIRTDYVRDH